MSIDFIDPHIHFFALTHGDYAWLQPHNPPFWSDKNVIHKDFSEVDLLVQTPLNLKAYVHIEAGFDNENGLSEASYWLDNATLPMTTIACADVTMSPDCFRQKMFVATELNDDAKKSDDKNNDTRNNAAKNNTATFGGKPITGIRHILDENALSILTAQNTRENFCLLDDLGFLFELQMDVGNSNDFSALMKILEAQPSIRLSVNHAGTFKSMTAGTPQTELNAWRQNMRELSEFNNCYVKVSGFEMQNRDYEIDTIKRVLDETLNAIGEDKTMFASNFPLVLFSNTYENYWRVVLETIESLGLAREALVHDNAKRCYFA